LGIGTTYHPVSLEMLVDHQYGFIIELIPESFQLSKREVFLVVMGLFDPNIRVDKEQAGLWEIFKNTRKIRSPCRLRKRLILLDPYADFFCADTFPEIFKILLFETAGNIRSDFYSCIQDCPGTGDNRQSASGR
jgi:hypothetical protein